MKHLTDIIGMADDIAFFGRKDKAYDIVMSLDFYTHATFRNGRQVNPWPPVKTTQKSELSCKSVEINRKFRKSIEKSHILVYNRRCDFIFALNQQIYWRGEYDESKL